MDFQKIGPFYVYDNSYYENHRTIDVYNEINSTAANAFAIATVYKRYFKEGVNQGKDEKDVITIKLTNKDMDKFEDMLNKYHILSWKGFNKSDKNVLDGNSFSFRLRYNDDEKLSASGYMMYPNHYRDFKEKFEEYVTEIKSR